MTAQRRREPAGSVQRSDRRGAVRRSQRPHDAGDGLGPSAEHDRREVRGQGPLIEQVGDDLGVGGATDVEQQARVVGLGRGLRIDAQALGESHRDQGAVQTVLEGKTGAEIRCQAECCDQLGGADLIRARRGLAWHAVTVPQPSAQPPKVSSPVRAIVPASPATTAVSVTA